MGSIQASKTQEVVSMDVGVSKSINTTFQPHKLRAILNITSSCRRNLFSSTSERGVRLHAILTWKVLKSIDGVRFVNVTSKMHARFLTESCVCQVFSEASI